MENLDKVFQISSASPSGLVWAVERRMGKGAGYVYAKPGDMAGSYDKDTGYYTVTYSGKKYKVHRIVHKIATGEDALLVDHINQIRTDNKPSNLRGVSHAVNSRNRKKPLANTSGKTGVHWDRKRQYTYAVVTWYDLSGNKLTKSFSASKLGLLESFRQAVLHRDNTIAQLNASGAGYTNNHGR